MSEIEEEFKPSIKRERTRRIKASIIAKVLLSDKKLALAFDKLKEQTILDEEPKAVKPSRRKSGRPKDGKVTFEQSRIDALPEAGYAASIARALGIKRASLQQWCGLEVDPLPCIKRDGHTLLRKDVVVRWLIKTKRYKVKPEYEE